MSGCYAVASGKGGVGKSVITANLAAALAANGTRTLIIDADIGLRSQDAILSQRDEGCYPAILKSLAQMIVYHFDHDTQSEDKSLFGGKADMR